MSQAAKSTKNFRSVVVLRLGLAFVFAYAAISAIHSPQAWLGFIPHFVGNFVGAKTALFLIAITQLVLAGLLIIGKFLKPAAILCIALLAGIIVFNFSAMLITFRDIGLICMALALFFLA